MTSPLFDTTSPAITQRQLHLCAETIRQEFHVAEQGQQQAIMAYRRVGEALIQAKELCGHGKWLAWLKANVPFSQQQASRYMRLAKLPVTGNLEDQWRVILGNAPDEEEPEPQPDSSEPTPPAPLPAGKGEKGTESSDAPPSSPTNSPSLQGGGREVDSDEPASDSPTASTSAPSDSDSRQACLLAIVSHLRKLRDSFDELFREHANELIRSEFRDGSGFLFELKLVDCKSRTGRVMKNKWICRTLESLFTAATRVRPVAVCAGCRGSGRSSTPGTSCVACRGLGFVPADRSLLQQAQPQLDFPTPPAPWEERTPE